MSDTANKKLLDQLTDNTQLQRYLSRNTRDVEEAADIYQESVMRVLEQARESVIENPLAYAKRVARNLLLRRSSVSTEDVELLDNPGANPEQLLDHEQRINLIYQALSAMPAQRRKVFELRRIHGESREEIAQKLGIGVEAVTRHISRAMVDIQRHLDNKN
ncbi:sigma-70 family RNA polymerase sigma factor [Alteromonas pelagimontana]|uniref:Sigma-70 family RNA polymerase sigma factor n=1 Tax=Alteromonas pelagimontana TaxID=1858656 RepID=A0A6M4MBZ7_9ALTE|nr:sigma-70 family RNA polymerase sigma factor [Alteromonas pelagimontana]QJR80724.1 sigma-70 family RNA polymerase sigma factor [Alteromonas pelagimontana]